ncbi:MAG: FAD-binding oxidoreductase [Acidobacteria bacterium]|nr:FAD-binding oxidoreductase [Acidobacteriota bacterium]
MSKIHYGVSPWLDRLPKRRRPSFAKLRGELDVDVAIVGGGFVGCAAAYAFSALRRRVVLIEAGQIGEVGTGAATGIALPLPGSGEATIRALHERHGVRAAREMFRLARRGALDLASTLKRLKIRCDLVETSCLEIAAAAGDVAGLRREFDARRAAGLDATWMTPAKLSEIYALSSGGAIRTAAGAHLDPFRACLGLAAAAARNGVTIYDRSPVRRVKWRRKDVEIKTAGATVRAGTIVVATGYPAPPWRSLARHFSRMSSFAVMTPPLWAAERRIFGRGDAVIRDTGLPPHVMGVAKDDRVLFSGADAEPGPERQAARRAVQRTGQLMYELSRIYPAISGLMPEYGWEGSYAEPVDGVPFIGPHRNFPHHLFALGVGPSGLALGFAAARVLLAHHAGTIERVWEPLGFARL